MLIGKPPEIPSSEITPQDQYLNRRRFMRKALSTSVAASAAALGANRLSEILFPSTSVPAQNSKL